MKSPEEIKKALECCGAGNRCATPCPFADDSSNIISCTNMLAREARTCIEQLEEQISLMKLQMKGDCGVCKHRNDERKLDDKQLGCRLSPACYECLKKDGRDMWEYEGLPSLSDIKNKWSVTRE